MSDKPKRKLPTRTATHPTTINVPITMAILDRLVTLTAEGMYGETVEKTAAQLLMKAVREEKEFWR